MNDKIVIIASSYMLSLLERADYGFIKGIFCTAAKGYLHRWVYGFSHGYKCFCACSVCAHYTKKCVLNVFIYHWLSLEEAWDMIQI